MQDCGQDLCNNITPKVADYVGNTERNFPRSNSADCVTKSVINIH